MRLATNPIHDFIHVLWARPLKTKGNGRTSGERHDRKIDTLANSAASAVPSVLLRMRRWRQLYSGPNLDCVVAPPFPLPSTFRHFARARRIFPLYFFVRTIFIERRFSKLPSNLSTHAYICRLAGAYCLNFVELDLTDYRRRKSGNLRLCKADRTNIESNLLRQMQILRSTLLRCVTYRIAIETLKGGKKRREKKEGKNFVKSVIRQSEMYALKFNVYRRTCPDISFHVRTCTYVRVLILPLKTETLRYRLDVARSRHSRDRCRSPRHSLIVTFRQTHPFTYYFNNLNWKIFQFNFFTVHRSDTSVKLDRVLINEWWKRRTPVADSKERHCEP